MRYLPHTGNDIADMLSVVGVDTLEDMFDSIPEQARLSSQLALPMPHDEWRLRDHIEAVCAENMNTGRCNSFLGAGCYEHYVPSVVPSLLSRSEFLTAYTPYQPEVSQGTLQAVYEYQTMVCRLLGMEVANASMYDGASALAEALLMAMRITRRNKVMISRAVHPHYREVVRTYLTPKAYEIIEVPFSGDGGTDFSSIEQSDGIAVIAVQSPNFFGCIEDIEAAAEQAESSGALTVVSFTEPLAYGLLKNPGTRGADIACGEGRSFGLSQSTGGMSLGIFTANGKHVRSMPGRLVGKTVDAEGNRGFVLTLATREQHIRREKATSNICTNQSLCAIGAAVYLSCLGKTGIRDLARMNYNKTEYLKTSLVNAGCTIRFSRPTFNEFVVSFPEGNMRVYEKLRARNIIAGLKLEKYYPEVENSLLICVTETKSKEDLDTFIREVGHA